MSLESIVIYLLLIIIGVLFIIILYSRYKTFAKSREIKNRFSRGRLLENQARDFLISKGFKIIEEQKQFSHKYYVNNTPKSSTLKVDYFVSKNGKKYLVEVKSGQSAIFTSNSNTRRQLLEYSFAILNDGVILLDMENQKLKLIEFINIKDQSIFFLIKVILVISFIGILIPLWKFKIVFVLFLAIIFFLKPTHLRIISKKIYL